MKSTVSFWVSLVIFLSTAGNSAAQQSLDFKVQKLEETVRALETRVVQLEDRLRERNALTSTASDKVNWRKLQMGMSESEVEKLLGSPVKVDAFGSFTVWRFSPGGQVHFDGKSRNVRAWHEP